MATLLYNESASVKKCEPLIGMNTWKLSTYFSPSIIT